MPLGSGWISAVFGRRTLPLREFPKGGFEILGHEAKVEEENWPWYSTQKFYSLRIGETLQSRYEVLIKLGYGAYSTAWLCRDLRCALDHICRHVPDRRPPN